MNDRGAVVRSGIAGVLDEELVEQLIELPSEHAASMFDELTPRFLSGYEERVRAVLVATAAGDADRAARLAHSLAGSLGTFGARRLALRYAEFECRVREGVPVSELLATLDALAPEVAEVRDALHDLLERRAADGSVRFRT